MDACGISLTAEGSKHEVETSEEDAGLPEISVGDWVWIPEVKTVLGH